MFKPSRFDDGYLEVVAISGVLHLGRIRVRVARTLAACTRSCLCFGACVLSLCRSRSPASGDCQHTNNICYKQVGIDRPVRLAQAKEVRIRIKSFLPGQVRGARCACHLVG